MASFIAKTPIQMRAKSGTNAEIISREFALVDAAIDTAKIQTVDLTASMVSSTSLAANGVDLASGTNATYYAVWCVPVDIHAVYMDDFLTEAYVKETTDAKIEIVTEAASPVTIATRTLTAGGEAVKVKHSTAPAVTAIAAGTILNLKITATASSTGTGHAKVSLRYTID